MATKSLPDDDTTLTRYKEAFYMCYGKMPCVLVMKDIIRYLVEKGLLHSDLQSRIQAKETNAQQVECLLDDIRRGLEAGYPERFDALIQVVKEYAVRQNHRDLKRLSDDIQKILRGTAPKPLVDHHKSSLREKFEELNIEIDRNTVGVALLVSNDYTTLGTSEELSFTHRDADSMEQLFVEFGYVVYRKKNISSEEFMSCQIKLVKFNYPQTCRNFIVYFSGQGEDGSLLMQDGSIIRIENIVASFESSNKNLAKIFLIDVKSRTPMVDKVDCHPITNASHQGRITCLQRIPKVFNILVAYACTQYRSASEVSIGRRWSDCFIKALRESREGNNICYTLTRAKQLITELPDSQCHSVVADFTNNLACEVYFKQEAKQIKIPDQYHKQSSQHKSQCNNRKFSILFTKFLNNVICLLDKHCSDKLELCKGFCCNLKQSDDCKEPLFKYRERKRILKCKTFKELFYSPVCEQYSWIQTDIVETIIQMSELDEAEDELKRYNRYIISNKGTEILSDFVSEDELPPEAIKVSVIKERPHTKKLTVGEYQESRNAILEPLKVKRYTPRPPVIFSLSSLHLCWYVPEHAAEHMKKMAKMNESLLIKQSVVFIEIGKDVIFDHRSLKQQLVEMATASVQNSSSTVTTYLKAYHSCYRNMILLLPIDHFIIDLVEKDQLPGDLKSHIQAKETREMKVQCLLDNIEGGIKAGYSERFVKLIQAVKEYAVRERRHDLKKSAEDTLSQLPDAIGRDVGLQCDIMPMPVEPDVYSVMFVGNVGSGKSAAYNFFVQNKIFETGWGWMPFNRPSSHICVIAHKQVRLIDTPGLFECHHDHCVKEILKHVQLSNEGIHAIALVFNLTTRLGSFEIIIDDSWPFSSTFVLFTHAGVTENSDQEVIKLLLHPNCPNQFKRLMQKVNWRYMVLESIYPTGPSYHDSKSHELIEMIRKIFNDSQRALTVKDFNEVSLQKQLC